MSDSKVISFRAGGHFLNWIEAQKLEGESPSQAAQRILKEISGVSTTVSTLSTELSTSNNASVASTDMSTDTVEIVDKLIDDRLDPVMERMVALEERLGKLRA